MDQAYRAKLVEDPRQHPNNQESYHNIPVTISPHPPPSPDIGPPPSVIPIPPPNVYFHPYPSQPNGPTPDNMNSRGSNIAANNGSGAGSKLKVGSWEVSKPHPLLWLCLALSLLALVLEVPKGTLPTLTGRHRALRTREKHLNERMQLLNQLSTFLLPPLSQLLDPNHSHHLGSSTGGASILGHEDQLRLVPGLRFWNTNAGTRLGLEVDGERWWSVEELGEGASVVRSSRGASGEGDDREVWVLRIGDGEGHEDKALLNALTHSLLLRDRLLSELTQLKTAPSPACPACPEPKADDPIDSRHAVPHLSIDRGPSLTFDQQGIVEDMRKEELEKLEHGRRREREREKEVEEREREVGRREKWVVDEMRKLSDKVHSQATELTLEDRITERLKAYQRQLASFHEGHDEL